MKAISFPFLIKIIPCSLPSPRPAPTASSNSSGSTWRPSTAGPGRQPPTASDVATLSTMETYPAWKTLRKNDGKIHHFEWVHQLFNDWAIFNSYLSLSEGIPCFWRNQCGSAFDIFDPLKVRRINPTQISYDQRLVIHGTWGSGDAKNARIPRRNVRIERIKPQMSIWLGLGRKSNTPNRQVACPFLQHD